MAAVQSDATKLRACELLSRERSREYEVRINFENPLQPSQIDRGLPNVLAADPLP
jgi:hypothetical protein